MTITLKPNIEQALREIAARRGVTPDQLIEERLQEGPLSALREAMDAEERERRRQEALALVESGYFAHLLGPSSLMQDKTEERAREERRWQFALAARW